MEDFKKLNFENGFGCFNEDLSEYWIKQSKDKRLPTAWSNILTNEKFGSVVTDSFGGYTWYINSQTNRITPFENDAFTDKSFEYISFKCEDVLSTFDEQKVDNNFYTCFGWGYAKFVDDFDDIQKEITEFVPIDISAKIYIIKLKNISENAKKVTIKYNIKWQMADSLEHSIIVEKFKENINVFEAKNLMNNKYTAFICANIKDKELENVESEKAKLNNKSNYNNKNDETTEKYEKLEEKSSKISEKEEKKNTKENKKAKDQEKFNRKKEITVTIKPNEKKEIMISLGVEENEENIINTVANINENYEEKFKETKKYWKEKVQKVTSTTTSKSFDAIQNGWLVYQTLSSRMIAKTGYYQSSGGYGFRDQLQDAMGMKWVNADILKNQILYNASHQFAEGDVEHWWHEDSKLGIRSRYSDDMLWLPYAVLEYIDFTGDYGILKEKAGFIYAEKLKENEVDRVDYYRKNEGSKINYSPFFDKNSIEKNEDIQNLEKASNFDGKINSSKNDIKNEKNVESIGNKKEKNLKDNYIKDTDKVEQNKNNEETIQNKEDANFTIFEHCIRAIKCAYNLGNHNLPLMKNGDWNDGMNRIGNQGKGESVWLGFFLCNILERFIPIIDYVSKNQPQSNFNKEMSLSVADTEYIENSKNKIKNSDQSNTQLNSEEDENQQNENSNVNAENVENQPNYSIRENISKKSEPSKIDEICADSEYFEKLKQDFIEKKEKIKESLNTICWDGMWYLRAFDDNGNKVGSNENSECKIDSISQSFSVISGVGEKEKQEKAMQSLEKYLVDENVVKLLAPPLENLDLGYISSYPKGTRENGGQYTHSAIWAMIAELMLGRKKEAFEIYKKINPVERTSNEDRLSKYKVEPYVVAGDIYSEENLAGRGGWTWYTGSSAWLYEAQIRYILGIKIYHEKMKISPNVSDDWKQFEVNLRWKNANYKIKYYNLGLEKVYMKELKDIKEDENKGIENDFFNNEISIEESEKNVDCKQEINQSEKNVDCNQEINQNEKLVKSKKDTNQREKDQIKNKNNTREIGISSENEEIELKPEGSYLIEVRF